MPTIDLPDDELAAVTVAIRGVIAGDRYPHAPRLDPLRAALARLDAGQTSFPTENKSGPARTSLPKETKSQPAATKAPPPAKADKRARR